MSTIKLYLQLARPGFLGSLIQRLEQLFLLGSQHRPLGHVGAEGRKDPLPEDPEEDGKANEPDGQPCQASRDATIHS